MRLMVDNFLKDAASLGSPEVDEIRWLKPVRGGDTRDITKIVTDKKASNSKPERGIVHIEARY